MERNFIYVSDHEFSHVVRTIALIRKFQKGKSKVFDKKMPILLFKSFYTIKKIQYQNLITQCIEIVRIS